MSNLRRELLTLANEQEVMEEMMDLLVPEFQNSITRQGKEVLKQLVKKKYFQIIEHLFSNNQFITDNNGNTYLHYLTHDLEYGDITNDADITANFTSLLSNTDYRLYVIPNHDGNIPIHLIQNDQLFINSPPNDRR